ncbi:carboxy-S-adenosyl-L-methionine synthase CmoA [Acanthopleuribacter pedis]|uniref:Carboxy-S-adenosyl-L-methionine synthase n=1 Tax=Acanthopleuribacter pedis TaxID=442870 RepID=A0A8J7QIU0_9BACT|nr:carboxy-S-adenosyl-L-methionine synthase CmoA [Acanthopleuribacter pedis]MBO1323175.1 carboxy-S-adenosyl-L-methionine synthase CmoA [Acanthopleuribacter pedis]
MKDELFKKPITRLTDFQFSDEVAAVFDDMLNRSVPFYDEVQNAIVDLVAHHYQPGTRVYDLGCSTGLMMAKLLDGIEELAEIVGIDDSQAMIDKTAQRFANLPRGERVVLHREDLRTAGMSGASAVIMNYTLQFVRPLYREQVVRRIFEALEPGGVFVLSEKVLEDSTNISRLFIDMYYQFKRRQGYSNLEISQKREMLENVLIPYKVSEQRELLCKCGFAEVETFFKWHNFASFIAIKKID